MRTPIMAANWKMNKTAGEAAAFVREFLAREAARRGIESGVEVVICPPFTAIQAVLQAVAEVTGGAARPRVALGAQDLYWEKSGAFTGEVSAAMLLDAGCSHVIAGHSERRRLFGETDDHAGRKVVAAAAAGLIPILCVGETGDERDSGLTSEVVVRQVRSVLEGLAPIHASRLVIAYEPVWAIGTGRPATPADAREAAALIRSVVAGIHGASVADQVRVQYGGSVSPDNISGFMAEDGVDGALVGGASLDPASFAGIVDYKSRY
ncbi:MAG: triose-phosphate isomerase [Firmicutes bacterium]|nr:triose-phosphate isomerase [Bacillota bacterium]